MNKYKLSFSPYRTNCFTVTLYIDDPKDFYGSLTVPLIMDEGEFNASIPLIKDIIAGGLDGGYEKFVARATVENLAPKRIIDFLDMWVNGEYGVDNPHLSREGVDIKYFDAQGRRFNVELI